MTQLSLTRSINLQREAAVGAKTGGDIKMALNILLETRHE